MPRLVSKRRAPSLIDPARALRGLDDLVQHGAEHPRGACRPGKLRAKLRKRLLHGPDAGAPPLDGALLCIVCKSTLRILTLYTTSDTLWIDASNGVIREG